MKKVYNILVLITFIFSNSVFAEELKNKLLSTASEEASNYVSNIIPGEGYTEFGINFRENHDFL